MIVPAISTSQRMLFAEEHLGSRQVHPQDHMAVATVWTHLDKLLYGQHGDTATFVSDLTQMLPSPASIPADKLAAIVQLHLQSASHMKTTLRLLLPGVAEASDGNATEPISMERLVESLPPTAEAMVATLIDLQIFHLRRAQEITARMRLHVQARARASASS